MSNTSTPDALLPNGTKKRNTLTPSQALKKTPPWRKKRPKIGKSTKLSPEDKQAAKTRAATAGRPYPNLVDNMWAASRKKTK